MTEIKLANIDEELKRLWDEEQGKSKVRACLFNLIIYTQKTGRDQFYRDMIKSVVSKFPSRVILISSDDKSTESCLRTNVTTETIGEGELQVFCEVIEIDVAGDLHKRVPYIVLPHILSDLPLYLLWTQDPSKESTILPSLEKFARRIIFDPEASIDLQKFSQTVLALTQNFHCEIGDLNWSALSGWRKIFTSIFNTPENLALLEQSKRIRITYNKHEQFNEIKAAYLQGWLAARFNWKFQAIEYLEGNIRLSYKLPTHDIEILLAPENYEQLPSGALVSIEIESLQKKAHFIFKRHLETRRVLIQYSDQDHCDLPYYTYLTGVQEGQEIVEEIFYQSTGTHYQNMLGVLTQIPWQHL